MGPYLITGGTGLIGNYVVRELVDRGLDPEEIIVYDLYPNEPVISDVIDDVTLIRGDVTDTDQLRETFEEHDPRRVVHLAALVAHRADADPTEAIRVNSLGTDALFEAARIADVETCLFASTASVYATTADYHWTDDPVASETDPVKPETPYTVTKYTNEVIGRAYDEAYDPNYVGVRIGGAWGRGRMEGATGELNTFIRDAGVGRDVTVPPYWRMWDRINLSYGKEVGRWFVEVVNRDSFTYSVYNQGNRESYTLDDVVDVLTALHPRIEISSPEVDSDQWSEELTSPPLDCGRWYDDLGLTQEWSVEDAVIDFVNEHREDVGLEPVSLP